MLNETFLFVFANHTHTHTQIYVLTQSGSHMTALMMAHTAKTCSLE